MNVAVRVPDTAVQIQPEEAVGLVIPTAATVTAAPSEAPTAMNVPGERPPVFREPAQSAEPPRPSAPAEPLPKGDGLRGDQWLYLLDGAPRGPIDVEDLIDLILSSIPEDTKVWHPGLDGWVRANQLRDIADEIPPPLPIPGAQRGYVDEDMPDFNTVPPMLRTVLIADEDTAFRKYLAMPLRRPGLHHLRGGGRLGRLAARRAEPALDGRRRI